MTSKARSAAECRACARAAMEEYKYKAFLRSRGIDPEPSIQWIEGKLGEDVQ